VKTLVPTSAVKPQPWRYTFENPGEDWYQVEADNSNWREGKGGFGTEGTPGAAVGTEWKTSDIWIRRSFELREIPDSGQLNLVIHHDEDAEVYINGTLVKKLKGYVTNYSSVPFSAQAAKLLRRGRNTLAAHCHQTRGGQYIDVGLEVVVESKGRRR
jgi:hypothetical protein